MNNKVFVDVKVTNREIYDKLCQLEKKIDGNKWHIRGLWCCVMGIIGFLINQVVLK